MNNPYRILFQLLIWQLLLFANVTPADELTDLLTGNSEESIPPDKTITTDSSINDDLKIHKRLQEIFKELDALKDIRIDVNKGVVTLAGQIESRSTENKALQFAQQIEGVVDVQNELAVNRTLLIRLEKTWQKMVQLAQQTAAGLPLLILALSVIVFFWWIGSWLSKRQYVYRQITPNRFIADLLGQVIHFILFVLGIVLALILLDATALIGTILGAAGIVGLAVGFAVRDTVENYISSILLSLRNPFEVNDFININDHEGNVLMLTSRATVLISPDGNHIRIPNATVFKAIIINYTRNPERRFQFELGVDTEQDLLVSQALALEAIKDTDGVLTEPKPSVAIIELGDSNVILRLYGWVNQTESSLLKVRSEVIRKVKDMYDNAGIVMPEPIYNLRVSSTDGYMRNNIEKKTESPTKSVTEPTVQSSNEAQDTRPDRTVEKQVEEERAKESAQNLLNSSAPKEM